MDKNETLKFIAEKISNRLIVIRNESANSGKAMTITEMTEKAIREADEQDGIMFLVFEEKHGEKPRCGFCGQVVANREIALFKGMARTLNLVWQWCLEKQVHEFKRKEIKQFLTTDNIIARFGDWALFGGLVYKQGKGNYGLNMERCRDFFQGRLSIPTKVWKDPLTHQLEKVDYKFVYDIPELKGLLDENGKYKANYAEDKDLRL